MQHLPLCPACFADLPWDTRSFHEHSEHNEHNSISAFYYRTPINNTLRSAKFGKQLSQLQWLATLTAIGLKPKIDIYPQAIIPVPLHRKRLHQRGFNQALELVKPLASQLHIPIRNNLITRIRHTQAQSGLAARERDSNIQGAFCLRQTTRPHKLTHIALFDDVITTGATLNEIKQLLHTSGIRRVDLWSCARTIQ